MAAVDWTLTVVVALNKVVVEDSVVDVIDSVAGDVEVDNLVVVVGASCGAGVSSASFVVAS